MTKTIRCFFLVAVLPAVSDAHEFWLESSTYRPPARSVVRISSWLGERFAGQPILYDTDHCEKFELSGPGAETPVLGRSGGLTAFGRVGSEGTYVVGYRSKRYFHEMDAQRFEAYLKEEGLGRIVTERQKLGESAKVGREAYIRYAKSLLTVGTPGGDGYKRKLGHALEIIAQ